MYNDDDDDDGDCINDDHDDEDANASIQTAFTVVTDLINQGSRVTCVQGAARDVCQWTSYGHDERGWWWRWW